MAKSSRQTRQNHEAGVRWLAIMLLVSAIPPRAARRRTLLSQGAGMGFIKPQKGFLYNNLD